MVYLGSFYLLSIYTLISCQLESYLPHDGPWGWKSKGLGLHQGKLEVRRLHQGKLEVHGPLASPRKVGSLWALGFTKESKLEVHGPWASPRKVSWKSMGLRLHQGKFEVHGPWASPWKNSNMPKLRIKHERCGSFKCTLATVAGWISVLVILVQTQLSDLNNKHSALGDFLIYWDMIDFQQCCIYWLGR